MTTPMTCDELALALADYLEGDVDDGTRERVDVHARSCGACGALLSDLRRIEASVAALPVLAPPRDLWSGIAARIETPVVELKNTNRPAVAGSRRRNAWLGVAAAALVAVTATVTQQVTSRSMTKTSPVASNPAQPASVALVANRGPIEAGYDREISRLRAILNERRPLLDSATVAVVERNLSVIDEAIAQCDQALRRDPSSRYLIESLRGELDTKVQLLRTAAALPSRS